MSRQDLYFAAWALVLPMTSILVLPSVQGTTPAYLFALAILFPAISMFVLPREAIFPFYYQLAKLLLVFLTLNSLAQLSLAFSNILTLPPELLLVDTLESDQSVLARKTMFTQSLYLLACISTFVYVRTFYSKTWDKYCLLGATLLGSYGVYECIYFLAFGESGDFLSNRVFDKGDVFTERQVGSFFQTLQLGPVTLQRLKSLTGEPSMYAFAVLPFWIYALHTKRTFTHLFLLMTLLMSTATTALLGIVVYLLVRFWYYGPVDRLALVVWPIIMLVVALGLSGNIWIVDAYAQIVGNKLALQSASGQDRWDSFVTTLNFFLSGSLFTQLFGIGFGYVRSSDFLSTVLVNLGVVGSILTTVFFFYPVWKLGNTEKEIGIKATLIVIFVTMVISVPDYMNLPVWLFLGIAYYEASRRQVQTNIGSIDS